MGLEIVCSKCGRELRVCLTDNADKLRIVPCIHCSDKEYYRGINETLGDVIKDFKYFLEAIRDRKIKK